MHQGKASPPDGGGAIRLGSCGRAAILGLMAARGGLIALFFWLEPQVGSIAAMGVIAGGLLVIALSWRSARDDRPQGNARVPAVVANPVATADIARTGGEAKLDLAATTLAAISLGRDYLGLGDFQPRGQ